MKEYRIEYRIVCDRVDVDAKGHSLVITEVRPINESGQIITTVFTDKENAEMAKVRYEAFGKTYEEKSKANMLAYPSLFRARHQYNYRIQSREVTDWE